MSKKKLVHFQENLRFPYLFQPNYQELQTGFHLRSKWKDSFFMNQNPIVLELGCGKGEYTAGLAERYAEKNFLGIDNKGARLWRGCKTVEERTLKNAGFIRTLVDHVESIFDKGEVSEIWITFPDPHKKKERKRLTAPVFLDKYRNILSRDGIIHLKTDDRDFYLYTLDVVREQKIKLIRVTDDLYQSGSTDDEIRFRTFYETRWLEMGKKICYARFRLNTD